MPDQQKADERNHAPAPANDSSGLSRNSVPTPAAATKNPFGLGTRSVSTPAAKAKAAEASDTISAVVSDATGNTAHEDGAGAKNKPTPLPKTWVVPKAYDPEKFGYPLPGPNPAWKLGMPKGVPDVSRAYRTKIYADEEDRAKDEGIEKLVFLPQDQAPYTAMGMSWAQDGQSQAKYVMSHHEDNASDEHAQAWIAYQAALEGIRAQKAREAQANVGQAENGEKMLRIDEADADRTRERFLHAQQAQEESDNARRAERERLGTQEAQAIEPDTHSAERERRQADQDSKQPVSAGLPFDPDDYITELFRTIRNYLVGMVPQKPSGILSSTANWIMDQYRFTRAILGEVNDVCREEFLRYLRPSAAILLLGIACWILYTAVGLIPSILAGVHTDLPYSPTHNAQPMTSTKATAKPTTARTYVQSEQQSSYQNLNVPLVSSFQSLPSLLASSFGSLIVWLTSTFGSLLNLLTSLFDGFMSFWGSLLNLLTLLYNGFVSFWGDLFTSERIKDDLIGLSPIVLLIVFIMIGLYGWRHAKYLEKLACIPKAMKTALDKVWHWAGNVYNWLVMIWWEFRKGSLKIAAGSVLGWTLFVLWSALMFLAGFGFRDLYDGFEKVTIVASPC